MVALSERGHYVSRSGVGNYYTEDGRLVKIGIKGQSDLHGHRYPDGRAWYIECKTKTGKPTIEQSTFLVAMRNGGALAGVARNVGDALKIVEQEDNQ